MTTVFRDIGAYRIEHGSPLYKDSGAEDSHADTYGPVTYLANYPFVKAFPAYRAFEVPSAA